MYPKPKAILFQTVAVESFRPVIDEYNEEIYYLRRISQEYIIKSEYSDGWWYFSENLGWFSESEIIKIDEWPDEPREPQRVGKD